MLLTRLPRIFPPLRLVADSVYVQAEKRPSLEVFTEARLAGHLSAGNSRAGAPAEAANLFSLLCCRMIKGELILDRVKGELMSGEAHLAYPIIDGVPVLLEREARKL